MTQPRSAAAAGRDFPYRQKTTCYIEVGRDGTVRQVDSGSYDRAVAGESRLSAVWPGEWRSDLFAIDEYARATGRKPDAVRTGLKDHKHEARWAINDFESKPTASHIWIDVWLECGCRINDIKTFATHIRTQRGWDVATSGGWGSIGGIGDKVVQHSVRVRRKSLDH